MMIRKVASQKLLVILPIIIAFSAMLSDCSTMTGKKSDNNVVGTITPVVKVEDGGFLSDKPCGPPCFLGVIPGTATKAYAIKSLQSSGLYQGCEEFDNTRQGGIHAIGCNYIVVFLGNDANIVSGIGFQPSQRITVEEVIAKYGEPDAVLVGASDPSDLGQFTSGMTLYYDSIDVTVGLAEQKSYGFDVTPTTLVVVIKYNDHDSYNQSRRYVQKWSGYGVYEQ